MRMVAMVLVLGCASIARAQTLREEQEDANRLERLRQMKDEARANDEKWDRGQALDIERERLKIERERAANERARSLLLFAAPPRPAPAFDEPANIEGPSRKWHVIGETAEGETVEIDSGSVRILGSARLFEYRVGKFGLIRWAADCESKSYVSLTVGPVGQPAPADPESVGRVALDVACRINAPPRASVGRRPRHPETGQ